MRKSIAGKADLRVRSLLEQLPPSPAIVALRRELQAQIERAVVQRDTAALEKLYREIQALARSLGVGRNGQISTVNRIEQAPTAKLVKHNPGPGLPGWGRRATSRRVGYSGPAREHAPLRYPHGDPPVSRNHGLHVNISVPSL